MGTLHYGTGASLAIDDVTLHHLAAVAVAKLRRDEPFLLAAVTATGRESLWIHRSATMRFAFDAAGHVALDRERLEAMVRDANRPGGLEIVLVEPVVAAVAA